MKTKPGSYDASYSAYIEYMAKELSKRPKRPKSTVQCASTQAVLDRPVDQDLMHWMRPIPLNWKANPNAKTLDEVVGFRFFDATQVAIIEDIRHKARNTLGQTKLSSVTPESKEKAIHAFTYAPPAELSNSPFKFFETKLTEIIKYEPKKGDLRLEQTPKPNSWEVARTWWDKLTGKWRMKNYKHWDEK